MGDVSFAAANRASWWRRLRVVREAAFCTGIAAVAASLLVWLAPPGGDLAAHEYQRSLFLLHGFTLWDNFWYAGRYAFVSYSILYYPLAALLGIRLLALLTVALAAGAFALLLEREWGPAARWAGRCFALVWPGVILAGEFPLALGVALALLCLLALQAGRLFGFLAVYLLAVIATYAIPSGLGHDVARVRLFALPITLLVAALRRWRPLPVVLVAIGLAATWNVFPLASGWASSAADRSANPKVWTAPVAYLRTHLQTGYRVEAVDTSDHWAALYLARAGIPLVRGWFRQDDHPVASLLYRQFTAAEYDAWLHRLGVAYVVLTDSPPDHSSRHEADLVRSGKAGLRQVFASPSVSIYAVPQPQPIVIGPGRPELLALGESRLLVHISRGGTYDVAVRWSPYWHVSRGCLARSPHGMLRLRTPAAGTVRITFDVDAGSLFDAFVGSANSCAS